MEHIAIDLGGRESQICIRNEKGEIVYEGQRVTRALGAFLKTRPPSRVIVEACTEAFGVADSAMEHGHEVRVVPSTLAPSLGVGRRGVKTDQRDAQALSEVSCRIDLPSVHIPSTQTRERRSLCTARESLIDARTQLINSVRGYLRSRRILVRGCGVVGFPDAARRLLTQEPQGLPHFVDRQLLIIAELTAQIKAADKELRELAKNDPQVANLMTAPFVGAVTAVRFAAAIEDAARFPSARKVESYLGLTPGEHSSSLKKRRTGITKAGPPRVRWALGQAALNIMFRSKDEPIAQWAWEIANRRGRKVACVALTRRLAGILFAMMRDGTPYSSTHRVNLGSKEQTLEG